MKAKSQKVYPVRMFTTSNLTALAICLCLALSQKTHADLMGYSLGDSANYVAIFQGGGGNQLNVNNPSSLYSHTDTGNIGIAGTGSLQLSGPLSINGNVNFAGTVQVNDSSFINGTINGNVSAVQTDMNNLNSLSTSLGAEAGTSIALNSGGSINVASGTIDAMGNSVFTVSSINAANGNLTITGDGTHKVVINISAAVDQNLHFNNIVLAGGLTSDDVLFNIYGGSSITLTGGPGLDLNSNGGTLNGIFLDPFGDISVVSTILDGRVYGGDSHNEAIVSGATLNSPVNSVPDGGSTALLLCFGIGTFAFIRRTRLA